MNENKKDSLTVIMIIWLAVQVILMCLTLG